MGFGLEPKTGRGLPLWGRSLVQGAFVGVTCSRRKKAPIFLLLRSNLDMNEEDINKEINEAFSRFDKGQARFLESNAAEVEMERRKALIRAENRRNRVEAP